MCVIGFYLKLVRGSDGEDDERGDVLAGDDHSALAVLDLKSVGRDDLGGDVLSGQSLDDVNLFHNCVCIN